MKKSIQGHLLLPVVLLLNIPIGIWDRVATTVNGTCGCDSTGIQHQGRALVTLSAPTESHLACADAAIDKAALADDAACSLTHSK